MIADPADAPAGPPADADRAATFEHGAPLVLAHVRAGIARLPRRRRSTSRARASASSASTTASRASGRATTPRRCASSRGRSRPSSSAARSPPSCESSTVRLDLGFAAANIGSFDWNLVTNALHWDDRLMELFGYAPETYVPHIDSFTVRLHPEDRAKTEAAIAPRDRVAAATTRPTIASCTPTARCAGSRRAGGCCADQDGPAGPDARRRLRHDRRPQRLRAPRARAGDDEHGVLHARPRLALHLRQRRGRADPRPRATSSARSSGTVYDDLDGTESDINYRAAMASGAPTSFEQFYPPLDARFDVRVTPNDDGISVYFHDITDRVRAEQERAGGAASRPARATGPAADPQRRRAPGSPGRSRSTSCCASSATSSSTASATGSSWRSRTDAATLAGRRRRPRGRRASRERLRALRGEPLDVDRFGARTARAGLAESRRSRTTSAAAPAPGAAADLARADARRGVVIGAVESALDRRVLVELAARAGVALDNAVLFGAERRLALDPAALAAADRRCRSCRASSSPRATCPARAGRTSAATSTSATRSRTAACCW